MHFFKFYKYFALKTSNILPLFANITVTLIDSHFVSVLNTTKVDASFDNNPNITPNIENLAFLTANYC